MKTNWYVITDGTKKQCTILCFNKMAGCAHRESKNRKLVIRNNDYDDKPGCCSIGDQLEKDGSNWEMISNGKLLSLITKQKDELLRAYLKRILKKRL